MLRPPVTLALARDERRVPAPDPPRLYEPKLDGWRGLLFTDAGVVQSRRDNDLAGRFPEIVTVGRQLGDVVLDGELVALRTGRLDFGALTSWPASRAAAEIVIYFIAFDLLAERGHDLRGQPLRIRRDRLERLFTDVEPPVQIVPSTMDLAAALRWLQPDQAAIGIEGVVAKDLAKPYRAGRTGDWIKVRSMVMVDAVTIGVTGPAVRPEALVLARPDSAGALQTIGLSLPLSPALRDATAELITVTGEPPRRLPGHVLGHPGTDFQPVHPTLVVEVEAEPTVTTFSGRLRPRVHRLRPDLTATDINLPPPAVDPE